MIELIGFSAKGWGSVLLMAALMTVLVTLAALLVGAVLGALVAAAKLHPSGLLRRLGDGYTTVFRGIPELLVIYLFFYGGSALVSSVGGLFGAEGFISMPAFLVGALAVGVVSGAYQAEVYRGAFQAVSRSELEAAKAIGMPLMLRFRRIIAPQILRFALPGIGGVWQITLKDSAIPSLSDARESRKRHPIRTQLTLALHQLDSPTGQRPMQAFQSSLKVAAFLNLEPLNGLHRAFQGLVGALNDFFSSDSVQQGLTQLFSLGRNSPIERDAVIVGLYADEANMIVESVETRVKQFREGAWRGVVFQILLVGISPVFVALYAVAVYASDRKIPEVERVLLVAFTWEDVLYRLRVSAVE